MWQNPGLSSGCVSSRTGWVEANRNSLLRSPERSWALVLMSPSSNASELPPQNITAFSPSATPCPVQPAQELINFLYFHSRLQLAAPWGTGPWARRRLWVHTHHGQPRQPETESGQHPILSSFPSCSPAN